VSIMVMMFSLCYTTIVWTIVCCNRQ
jgi:hypothetical protein